MSELKPGRRAILGYVIDESIQVGDLCWQGPLTLVRGQGTGALFTSADRDVHVIPDVPNLAAVARVLAANPGIGEALARAEKHIGSIHGEWFPDEYENDIDQWSDDICAIGKLAAALNGGTE